jgi:PAS domain S-box-containing protein
MNNLILIYALILISITIFLASLLISHFRKKRYLVIFTTSYAFYLISYVLLSTQSFSNLYISSLTSNLFLVGGYLLLYKAFRLFFNSEDEWPLRFWLYLISTGLISYFTAILYYNVIYRNILLGSLTVLIFIDFGMFVFKRFTAINTIVRNAITFSLLINLVTNALRPIIAIMVLSPQSLPVDSNALNIFVFTSYAVTSVFWLSTIILMDGTKIISEIKISEEKYRSLVESSDTSIILVDITGKVLFINKVAASFYNMTPEELGEVWVKDILNSEQAASIMADIAHVLSTKTGITKEMILDFARGSRYFRMSLQPVNDESGKPYAVIFSATDISKMKEAQEKIVQSELNYKSMFFEAIEGKLLIKENHFIECNRAAAQLLEANRTQVIGLSINDISPEFQPNGMKSDEYAQEILNRTKQVGHHSFEWVHKSFSGKELIALVSLIPIIYDGEEVLLATWQDITSSRKIEEQMRKLTRAVEQSPVSIVITDIDGNIEYANPKASETTGYSNEELIGKNPRILQSGYTAKDEYSQLWSEVVKGKEWTGLFHNKRKNGELYWEHSSISPIFDHQGKITNYIAIKEDITEKKNIEEKLIINQNRLEQVADNSRTVIWEMDEVGNYTYINETGAQIFGYSANEIIGRSREEFSLLNQNSDNVATQISDGFEILRSGRSLHNYESQIVKKDGTIIWVSTSATPIFSESNLIVGYIGSDNDITSRKLLEEETRKFKTIADQGNTGNGIVSMDGTLIYANEAFSKMHGYESDELLGQNLMVLHGEEDHKRVGELLEIIKNEGGFGATEIGRTRKDGTRFPSLMSAKIIMNSQNEPQFMSANVIDITEMKQKESEIRRLSLAIEQSPVAVVITDLGGVVQYVSPAFETITGYDSTEIIGQHTRLLSSGLTKPSVYRQLWKSILSGESWKGEWINKKKSGELYFEAASITPVKDETGKVAYFLAVKENITQRKNAEEALLKSEEQFRLLFSKSPVSILIHDKDTGEIIDCNPETLRMLGIDSLDEITEFTRDNSSDFFDLYFKQILNVSKNGPTQFEGEFTKVSGEKIWVRVNLSSLEIWSEMRVLSIAMDITKQKQAEQEIIARQVAEEANRVKSVFFSNMSHEIRTPLNAINGFAQILRKDSSLTPKQTEQVKTILRSGEHLIGLINDILDISKIEAGRLTINESEFNLYELLDDIRMMFAMSAREKKLYFEFEIDNNIPKFLVSDEAKLRQILINLIGNAIKFTYTGGITLRVRLGQQVKEFVPLNIEVSDTGNGISEEDKVHLFDPFWQSSTGQAVGGTGLGLPITKNIVDLMGGKITVETKLGSGSTFKFHILARPSNRVLEPVINKQHNVVGIENNNESFRILVVDDRFENRDLLRELLTPIGFEILESENGLEAVESFESFKPHAILMDMRMSVMDGYEATRIIRSKENGNSVLIIGITASVFKDDLIKVKEAGADEVLNKPFRFEELFELLSLIPNLKFIYDLADINESAPINHVSLKETIKNLSDDVFNEMKTAIVQGNMVMLRKIANKLEHNNPEFTKEIISLARNYDYEKLLSLFNNREGADHV